MNVVLMGIIAGILHVFSGPDHLASIAPASVKARHPAWLYGLVWGGGHALGIGCIAALYFLFNEYALVERISSWSEKLVGLGLIWVGVLGIRTFLSHRVRVSGQDMDAERSDRTIFVFGILHGSAGAGHLLGLIPILAMNHVMDVSFYMFAYLLGTIVAMVGFAQGMRRLSDFFITRHSLNLQQLIFTCSLTALVLGGVWLIT
ncbi:MAG: hypothetical protein P8L18_06755 [Verrucomicrobiota bacterium]|nr:hypothetical protein [Verrucomicrobiota bacterium]